MQFLFAYFKIGKYSKFKKILCLGYQVAVKQKTNKEETLKIKFICDQMVNYHNLFQK